MKADPGLTLTRRRDHHPVLGDGEGGLDLKCFAALGTDVACRVEPA